MKCPECGMIIYEDILQEGVCPSCGSGLEAEEVIRRNAEDAQREAEAKAEPEEEQV